MLIASSGVLHFFKAPDTNSIYLTHRPDRADQNCPAFLYLALPSTAISTATPKVFYFLSFFVKAKIWLIQAKNGNMKK